MGAVVSPRQPQRDQTATAGRAGDGLGPELLLVLAALAAVAVGQGGFYRRVSEVSGGFLAVAAVLLVGRRRASVLQPVRWVLAGIAVLAFCTVVAATLDGFSTRALAPIALLGALAVVVAVVGASPGRLRRQLADVVIVLGGFVAFTGWVGVAFHVSPFGHPDGGLWRAATTVTYANAAAAVLGPVCLWSLARRTSSDGTARRAVSVMLATGLMATLSRAGLASFALGLVVLALLLGFGPLWRATAPTLLGAAIAAAALVPGIDAGSPAKPLLAGLGLVGGLLVGTVRFSHIFQAKSADGRQRRRLRIGLLGVVLGGAMAGVVLLVVGHSSPWSNRLSVASPDRGSLASVALDMWRTHLLSGVGPDHEVFIWMTPTHQELFDRYAHDEYLQLAVEEGAVGLLGLVGLVAGVATAVRRGWRLDSRRDADLTALRAGAIAGLVCFALQSGFDFLWHVPVVPMIAAVAVGLAVALPPTDEISQPKQQQEVPCSDKDG